MLKVLAAIFGFLSVLFLIGGMRLLGASGGAYGVSIFSIPAFETALTFAFFGAICVAVADMRAALVRLADKLAPIDEMDPALSGRTPPAGGSPADFYRLTKGMTAAEVMRKYGVSTTGDGYLVEGRTFATLAEAVGHAAAAEAQRSQAVVENPEQTDEDRLMAEYDVVREGEHYLAYGRYRHDDLASAIAHVKRTRVDPGSD